MEDTTPLVDGQDFNEWLQRNKLQSYHKLLEQQGYDLESLTLLNEEQINALAETIQMRPGNQN
jgi:hypothetical protein